MATLYDHNGLEILTDEAKQDANQVPVVAVLYLPKLATRAAFQDIEATLMHPFPRAKFPPGNAQKILHGFAVMARDQLGDHPLPEQMVRDVIRAIEQNRAKARGLA